MTSRELEVERHILSTMPVLYLPLWKRDGSSIISDDAYGHVCTVAGATGGLAAWTPQGRSFDGVDDNISVGTKDFFGSGQQTIEIWARPNSKSPAARGFLFNHYTADNNRVNIIQETDGIIQFQGGDVSTYTILASAGSSARQWLHIVVIRDYDEKKLNVWIDRIQTITSQAITIGATTAGITLIGYTSEAFNGIIGEVHIYNRALSPLEIANNYEITKYRYK